MNFYPFHIGDYASHTRHLSLMEDLAYRRLLDLYYTTERALNGSSTDVARRIGMLAEQAAVEYVLKEFFEPLEDGSGYQNKRCDEEIAKFTAKKVQASQAGKASAERRFNARSTDVQPTKNQEPRTKNQKEKSIVGQAPDVSPRSELKGKAKELLGFLNAKTGRNFEPVAVNLERIEARLKEGASFDDCKSIIAKKCGEWSADEKMAQYLRPATLFNREKFWSYHGQLEAM